MVSEYTERHELRPTDVLGEAIELGRRKVEGVAFKEYATVVKEFADAEQRRIDTELQRRTIGSRIRKEEAEARAAELTVLEKELELLKKLNETGVTIRRDESGNLTVLPLPPNCDLTRIGKT
jgi:threonyl-tRNA synthetase